MSEYEQAARRLVSAQKIVNRLWQSAPDVHRDCIPENEAVQAWLWIAHGYQLTEQAFKLLIAVRENVPIAELRCALDLQGEKAHHLDRLFEKLEADDRDSMARAYSSYRRLHCNIGIENVEQFLGAIGRGYTKWRYMLLEGAEGVPANHIGAMFELAAAASRLTLHVLGRGGRLPAVEWRLKQAIDSALVAACRSDASTPEEGNRSVEQLRRRLEGGAVRLEVARRLENPAHPERGALRPANPFPARPEVQLPKRVERMAEDWKQSSDRKNLAVLFRKGLA